MRLRSHLAAVAVLLGLPAAAMAQQPCYRIGTAPCVPFSIPALPTGVGAGVAPAGTAGNPLYVTGGTGGGSGGGSGGGGTVTQGPAGSAPWPVQQSGALPAGTNALGSVAVSNLPATQAVSGSVVVSNLPATQAVSAASALPIAPPGTVSTAVSPAVQATAYTGGQVLGGKLTLSGAARAAALGGLVQSASVSFAGGAQPAMDLVLFSADPTASTLTDKAALAVAAADLGKVVGVVHVGDCTLLGASAPSLCQAQQQAVPFRLSAGTSLFGALVARASVTPASTSDVLVTLRVLQD